jgi:hypothetical protein
VAEIVSRLDIDRLGGMAQQSAMPIEIEAIPFDDDTEASTENATALPDVVASVT